MYPGGPTAYDRGITVFSPDGRLFQVEYAREAVRRGTTALGIVYREGVLLAVDKNVTSPLIVPESIDKIFKIDSHIAVAVSGLVADARKLVSDARIMCQRHKFIYDEPLSTYALTLQICDEKQLYTQYGGTRPFGVSFLIAGVDSDGPRLFETDPSGAFVEYYAGSTGMKKREVDEFFEKNYKKDMNTEEALDLAMKALLFVSDGKLNPRNVDVVTIEKKYMPVEKDKIIEIVEKIRKDMVKEKESKKK